MTKYVSILALILTISKSLIAQDLGPVVEQIGPEFYPPAAHAVRAQGKVGVAVVVNSEGIVISAEPFAGHPLLKASAVSAAKRWRFEEAKEMTSDRNFTIFFDFKIGVFRNVDEAEASTIYPISKVSSSFFEIELTGDMAIPRFLRLPRTEGKLAVERCPLHTSDELQVEIQSTDCTGNNAKHNEDLQYWDNESYDSAEKSEFPKANFFFGCRDNGLVHAEVRFCEKCRSARSKWIIGNKG